MSSRMGATALGAGTTVPVKKSKFGTVPIDASKMPKATKSYSEWVIENLDAHLTQENPAQGVEHYQQNKEIYWMSFADWACKNVGKLSDSLFLFMQDQNSWIFRFFPLKISKATRYIQQNIDVHQELPRIGTRKVPFPNIS